MIIFVRYGLEFIVIEKDLKIIGVYRLEEERMKVSYNLGDWFLKKLINK